MLFPKDIKVSKSMKKFLKKQLYEVTFDMCFEHVSPCVQN
ncbi:leucyl/phenylalanyl-tRNA-protein transferase [Acetivibrio straminisolvens JCM 21531]|uniref:Leucyl/phenylalanyl-tRNA-protein transferase n=1 Tax=Acetivibrio straminisolvens JCM 21531 TaxID=1294263 RepID=W4VCM3_9FIRM|nr:leucyl/phenylalanyl-tRNA-protein transferase [Acetivibrio straminisolvens JCM 21531]